MRLDFLKTHVLIYNVCFRFQLLLTLGLIILAVVSIIYSFECSDSKFGIVDPDDITTTVTPAPGKKGAGFGIDIDDDSSDDQDTIRLERLVFIGFITRFVSKCTDY